uniref:Sucrose-phosphate synthase n=1 Tax=Fagus sylvatica TaxID=28930 RepID=A0A2N9EP00_FAGSY
MHLPEMATRQRVLGDHIHIIAWDDAKKLAKRHIEREQGRNDFADDLFELSEGEKEKGDVNVSESVKEISKINSDIHIWSEDDKSRRLYIVLISVHGLLRGENMELGRDSNTGGQVKYVVELARALANTKGVHRVDLLTRQITSPDVDFSYGEPIEMLSCPSDGSGSCGAYIIRLPCGPRDKYIPKESLWPYIPEFIDGALNHIVNMARALGEQVSGGKPTWPYVIHGHYADAGEVAAHLSGALNVPMVLTGHSLGRNKFEQLLKQGRLSREDINSTYRIMRRIEAEELGLDAAQMVVTSTRQEIEEQWGLYDGFDLKLERKLRVRRRRGVSCHGRNMPRMVVIPPGMDFSYVTTQDSLEGDGDLKPLIGPDRSQNKRNLPPIWSEVMRFFTNPHKPMILALSHPDPKKNVTTLLKAFGECQPLRELANLTLILGNRDDVEEMPNSSSIVLTTVLKLIDKYDLYGQVAYPKHHKQSEVPDIYRLAAKTKATAYGLPVVATKNGGPVDILKKGDTKINGELDAATRQKELIEAITRMASSKGNPSANYCPGRRQWLFVIATDCYNSAGECIETFQATIKNVVKAASLGLGLGRIGFVLSTSLNLQETIEALKCCQVKIEDFDALVCRSGSEMYYPWRDMVADVDYEAHVEYRWPNENVRSMVTRLARIEGETEDDIMEYVGAGSSRCYCYSVRPGAKTRRIDDLCQRLRMRGFRCNLVYTRLSVRWGIDLSKVVVFVGEKGDTDYEDLLVGLHKTIILRGSMECGSKKLLRSEDSFKREDVVPQDSPNITFTEGSYEAHDI